MPIDGIDRPSLRLGMILLLPVLLPLVQLTAAERRIVIGAEDDWRGLERRSNLISERGYRGDLDLRLPDAQYAADAETDLLLHFDDDPVRDAGGRYATIAGASRVVGGRIARRGRGVGAFRSGDGGVALVAERDALFRPGNIWDDFSIEFWLYVPHWGEGQTILLWQGARRVDDGLMPQELRVHVVDESLTWQLDNLFSSPSREAYSIHLRGRGNLTPRVWRHHLLRHDSASGLLEYLVDGVPESIAYATDGGRERGAVHRVELGLQSSPTLTIGEDLVGFLDELRISRIFVKRPLLHTLARQSGFLETGVIDLGSNGGEISLLDARYTTPDDTTMRFSYQVSSLFEDMFGFTGEWIPFSPGEAPDEIGSGRYLRLRAEFYPDGLLRASPRLSNLVVTWRPLLPLPPSAGAITYTPRDGAIELVWRPPAGAATHGFRIHYGYAPGRYFGTDAAQGASPIDVGAATDFTLTGLQNGQMYYLSIERYTPQRLRVSGSFAPEISARPFDGIR